MNENKKPIIHQPRPVANDEIDLLAEGELDANERRELIDRLEHSPGGWKQCALSFLESQSLRHSIDALVESGLAPRPTQTPVKPSVANQPTPAERICRQTLWLTAAIVLIASGIWIGASFGTPTITVAEANVAHRSVDGRLIVRETSATDLREFAKCLSAINIPDSTVIAVVDVSTELAPRFVPIIRNRQLAQQLNALPELCVPEQANRELALAGWQIKLNRQVLAVTLPNGRSTIMPFDSMGYHYVGKETF